MRKVLRILGWTLVCILLLITAAGIAVQSPKVQTALGRKAIQMMRERMVDADIQVGSINISGARAIVIKNLVVLDRKPYIPQADTLMSAGLVSARFSLIGLIYGNGAYVNRISAQDVLFQWVIEPDEKAPNGTRANMYRVFGLPYSKPDKPAPHWGNLLLARKVNVRNARFNMFNPPWQERMQKKGTVIQEGVIDWSNLHVKVDYAKAHNVKVANDLVTGALDSARFRDTETGLEILQASAKRVRVGKQLARVEQLHLLETDTELFASKFILDGNQKAYSDFINKVYLRAQIEKGSYFSTKTLSHLGPNLDQMDFRGKVQGNLKGYVSDLVLEDIWVQDMDHDVSVHASGSIVGLPSVQGTLYNFNVKEFAFTLKGLGGFVHAWAPQTHLDLGKYASGQRFSFSGRFKGPLNRLQVDGLAQSALGQVEADVTLRNTVDKQRPIIIGGNIASQDLDLGRLLGVKALGPLTLETGLEASFKKSGPEVRIDSLHISRLSALGYDYANISAAGTYAGDAFDGRIIASDPNLNFLFQGLFNLSPRTKNAAYRFYASLGYADLHALHIDKREQSKISFQASSNFLRTESRDLLGDVNIMDISLQSDTGLHNLGDISVRAHANDNLHRIRLESRFLDGTFVGEKSILNFVNDLKNLILDRELDALTGRSAKAWDNSTYELTFKMQDAHDLLDFLAPGLYVENPSSFNLSVDRYGRVKGLVKSGRVAYYDKYIKDLNVTLDNGGDVLGAELKGSAIAIAGALIKNNRLTLFANDNHVGVGYTFDNEEEQPTRAEVYLSADLSRDENGLAVDAQALPSNIYYQGKGWGLSSGDIDYRGGNLKVNRFLARHEDEQLLIDGGFSPHRADTLNLSLQKFDMSLLNSFTGGVPSLEGSASGHATLISPTQPSFGLLAGIVCDSTKVSGRRLGQLHLSSAWDDQAKRFVLDVRNLLNGSSSIDVKGYLKPSNGHLHADAHLNHFDLGYAAPFMDVLFTQFEGKLSGQLWADGTLRNLHLGSRDVQLSDGKLELDYTRVAYDVEGSLGLDDDHLYFNDLRLKDGEGGTGSIKGSILLGGFKNFGLDTHVSMNQMRVLALPRGVNPYMFGNAYASGRAEITGPLNKLVLDIDASSTKTGDFHLPMGSGSSKHSNQMLTFVEPPKLQIDPYEDLLARQKEKTKAKNDLTVKLRVRVTPDIMAYIDMEENSLSGNGNGIIELETRMRQQSFALGGYYTLQGGSFHFSAMNLVQRDFTIQNGSNVRFNGAVMDTDLDVRGLYTTKASLATLVGSEDGSSSNRRTVNCGINISGKLRNPDLDFTIDIPDLNPSVQAQVESALNTEDKIQKQFIYLLIANSFLPTEESGITSNGSEMLFSNVSSIMTGQLNNIFQKLNIPVDLGLNYQATQTGNSLFDVAVSTQLFNNRVLVNGTVGNKQVYGVTTNEVAGDIDIEVKLNRSGALRLNLFSHSADQFSSYLDNSQRNGGGIAYQREFNSFRQFFRELFNPARRRESGQYRQIRQYTLQIDSTGKASPKP